MQALPSRLEEVLKEANVDYLFDNTCVLTPAGVALEEPVGVLPSLGGNSIHCCRQYLAQSLTVMCVEPSLD